VIGSTIINVNRARIPLRHFHHYHDRPRPLSFALQGVIDREHTKYENLADYFADRFPAVSLVCGS
jgi:hypothetical protein